MDFGLDDEQQALVELAGRILGDRCTPERLSEVEAGTEWFDRDLWADLAAADLIGLPFPATVGGGGYGFLEACLLLEQVGRAVAPLPLVWTFAAGLAVARFGTTEQAAEVLAAVVAGDAVLTVAHSELDADARDPRTVAVTDATGGAWRLTGVKTAVPAAHVAAWMLVPARLPTGASALFLVDPAAEGVELARQDTFDHSPEFHVELADAPARLLGGGEAVAVDWLVDRTTVGLCAVASGVSERGMRLTAGYASERRQFDRQIATFQAVGQRMADTFIDNEAIRLTMLQAATKLDRGEPAGAEVEVAKFWASEAGSRVAHTGLHVHGGISIDVDYPIHRHFLRAKQIEFTLGAGTPQLAALGARLAADTA